MTRSIMEHVLTQVGVGLSRRRSQFPMAVFFLILELFQKKGLRLIYSRLKNK